MAVGEKEVVVVVAVEVERAAAGVARGTMTGQSKRLIFYTVFQFIALALLNFTEIVLAQEVWGQQNWNKG